MIGLDDLCLATGGQLYGEAAVRDFSGISDDPAQVRPGELFVVSSTPESGQDSDIDRALAAGAAGLLCETPPGRDVTNITTILVGDARLGLEQWAAFVMRQYHPLTIAVMGDLGKTSVCEAITAALGSRYPVYASSTAPGGPYQLAVAVANLEPHHVYAIFELSHDKFSNLNDMMAILQPHILVMSSLISQAVGRLQSLPNLPESIAQSVSRLPAKGAIVVNAADRDLLTAAKPESVRLVTYMDNAQFTIPAAQADVVAEQVHYALDSVGLNLHSGKEMFKDIRLSGLGAQAVNTALCALAACVALDFPIRDALAAFADRVSLGGLKLTPLADGAVLVDAAANAKPETALALLDWLDQVGDQVRRRFLVLGDFEPRGDRLIELGHGIGRRSTGSVDALISLDESTAPAVLAARRAGFPEDASLLPHQREEAAQFLRSNIGQGDIVIVLGEHSSTANLVLKSLAGKGGTVGYGSPQPARALDQHPLSQERSWLEIDLRALAENVKLVRRQLQNDVALIAVVKDDAFHHGAVEASRVAVRNGANLLAVSSVDEALCLRTAGLDCPVVVLGYNTPDSLTEAISAGLTISIQSRTHAALLAQASRKMKTRSKCHIRVTASARDAGVPIGEVVALVRELKKADQIIIDGLFIEFSLIPGPNWVGDSTRILQQFTQIARNLSAAGVEIPHVHVAGSAAMLSIQNSIFSAARIGHLMYGISPFATTNLPSGLKPVLAWKTSVSDIVVERVKRSSTNEGRRLGVIPVGYRDGLVKSQRNQASVLIGGARAPITDAVGPDWAYVDMTALPSAFVGSEAVLIGGQGNNRITIEEIAAQRGGASYDVISSLPATLRKYYAR